eukprot:9492254-Pyramimonas_sp.AAC.1
MEKWRQPYMPSLIFRCGSLWVVLGPSWGHFGRLWSPLEGPLGAILEDIDKKGGIPQQRRLSGTPRTVSWNIVGAALELY